MSSEILEEIVRFNATARGTGRTTRAVKSLRAWAETHPAEKGVMVTHDAQFAATLKSKFFADRSNVTVIGMSQGHVLRGSRPGALETDHHALAAMISGLLRENTKLRAEITRLESLISVPRACLTNHGADEGATWIGIYDFCPDCGTPLSAGSEDS